MHRTTALAALVAALLAVSHANQCRPEVKFSNGKTYTFDLEKLRHPDGQDDTLISSDPDYNSYAINICGSSHDCPGHAVCQETITGDRYGCGKYTAQQVEADPSAEPGKGIIVKYTKGVACNAGPERSTTIYMKCDKDAEDAILDQVQEGDCAYSLNIMTKWACGTEGGSSGGSADVAAIVILVLVVCARPVYFAVGAVYQWKVKGAKEPKEFVVNGEFWFALPGLVKDGCLFIAHGFRRGDYITVG